MSDQNLIQPNKPQLKRSGINRIINVVISTLLIGVILFGVAGRLNWVEGWAFLLIFVSGMLAAVIWTILKKPELLELLNERGRIWANAKPWDKIIIVIYNILFFGIFIVAALDARFRWSSIPLALNIVGGIALVLSIAMHYWVFYSNPYASSVVRIKEERGHSTITSGPYRFVRHPQYFGMFFMWWGISLLLGSWWALIPTLLCIFLFIVRITLEEKTLLAGLAGYQEYTQNVRYRFIPGIW